MANSNTFILLILWMIIIMIGTSNTGKSNPSNKYFFPLLSRLIPFDNRHVIAIQRLRMKNKRNTFKHLQYNLLWRALCSFLEKKCRLRTLKRWKEEDEREKNCETYWEFMFGSWVHESDYLDSIDGIEPFSLWLNRVQITCPTIFSRCQSGFKS